MRYSFKGKNMDVGERTREKVTDKLSRIEKLFPESAEAKVLISSEKLNYVVEVTVPINKRVVRAECSSDDMMAAVDKVVDKLEKQIIKYKRRLQDKYKKNDAYKEEYESINVSVDEDDEDVKYKIEKSKRFEIRPMDPEEAVMQMELLGHSFFVFRDTENDNINVVYKRKDGSFGIIEPE